MKRLIAVILLLCNFSQAALAAFPEVLNTNRNHQTSLPNNQAPLGSKHVIAGADSLNVTMDQLGIAGPLTGGVNYNSLTGAFFNGQFIKKLNDWAGFNILGEYGTNQYRINGTLGLILAPQSLFKVSAEQLSQRLPFFFDSGNIKKRVNQQAFGAKFQQYFNSHTFNNLSAGFYSSNAPNVRLKPITYISDVSNCVGFEAGLQCMNERNIAGARAAGGDLNLGLYLTPWTYVEGRTYYDSLRYHTVFSQRSQFDNQGFGQGFYVQQLVKSNLKLSGGAELRKIYDSYNLALSWMPKHPFARGSEFSLVTQRVVSHNQTPDNYTMALKLNVFADQKSYQAPLYRLNGPSMMNDISSWVQIPAVKMNQVLAIAEQYTHLVAPDISSISPSSGPMSGGNTIIISGSNFPSATTVQIDGKTAKIVSITPTAITLIAPPGNNPGTVDVVLLISGIIPIIETGGYVYTDTTLPVISSIAPSSVSTIGGTQITISGSGLSGTTAVTIDGIPMTSFVGASDTQVTAIVPAHGPGAVDVTVTTPAGTSLPKVITYTIPPMNITGVSPSLGPVTGGTSITITGLGLTGTTTVTLGGVAATNVSVLSDSQVTAITPGHAPGIVDVVASNGSTSFRAVNAFSYTAVVPVINVNGINPASGSTAGGTSITISGTGFLGTAAVTLGGTPAASFMVVSDSQITAITPAHVAGLVDVTVTTVAGTSLPQPFTYLANSPVINSGGVSPNSGPTEGGTLVTISGSGLTGITSVGVGGTPATNVIVVDDNTVTFLTPAHAAGLVDVVVSNGSTNTTAPNAFTYVAEPPVININGITPLAGPTAGGTSVTISGSGFTGTTAVTLGGNLATNVVVVNDSMLTLITPAHVAGTVPVTVITPVGTSAPQPFTYVPSTPIINTNGISPSSGSTLGGTTITISGSGFIGTTAVTIGGNLATNVAVLSDSQVTAVTPAHAAGAVDVTVTTAGGTSGHQPFLYVASTLAITSVNPITGSTAGGTLITLSGSGFTGATAVSVGGSAATGVTVIDDNTITALTPAHAAGLVDVIVFNASTNTSAPDAFTYIAPLPLITANGIVPSSGPTAGGTPILINGSGFTDATAITFNDTPTIAATSIGIPATSFSVLNDTQITAVTPAHTAGEAYVVVTTAGGTSASQPFTYVPPLPVINANGIIPSSGPIAGGTTITINGNGFTGATAVTVGGNPATNLTVVSDTQITAVTPAHAAGMVGVTVTTAGGSSAPQLFTYVSPSPVINPGGVTPASGPTIGGTSITINGSGLTGITSVSVGGVLATNIIAVNDSQVTAVTPAHVAGLVDVVVSNGSTNTTAIGAFTYIATIPVINSNGINPSSGSTAGGTSISIHGVGFLGATNVTIGSNPAVSFVVMSDTLITAVTPAHAVGPVGVTVTTAGGTSLPVSFTYVASSLVITNVTPSSGSTAGGMLITISGTGLAGSVSVSLGGTLATNLTVISDTEVTAITPAHVAGLVDVVVSNGNTNTTATNAYTYIAPIPVINVNGISPPSGSTLGGTTIAISGSGFIGASAVSIDGNPVTSYVVLSDAEITAVTPAHVAGTVNVTVSTAGGTSAPQPFTYVALTPLINPNGVSPASGPTAGGTAITISGSGLTDITAVNVGGFSATNVTVINDNEVSAITPAHVAGLVNVVVFSNVTNTTAMDAFTYVAPVPVVDVNGVSPSFGPVVGGTPITLTGSGFTGATAVMVGGVAATNVTVVSDTHITAVTPAHAAGAVDVTVTTAGGTSGPQPFTYVAPMPVINVNGISPSSGSTLGGSAITLTGSGFTGATAVSIDGSPATSFSVVSDTQMTTITPAHAAGLVDVTVTTSAGTSLPQPFTYVVSPLVISTITPTSGPTAGGTTITIDGSGLTGVSSVRVGGIFASNLTVMNDNQLTAVTPSHAAGLVDVVVANNTTNTTVVQAYTYIAPTPVIDVNGITPASGSTLGGTTITLNGSGFIGTTAVTIDGNPAASFTVVSDNQVTALTPAHAAGVVGVTIMTAGGISAPQSFTYVAPVPFIGSISPSSGSTFGGTSITINGSGLTGTTSVSLGGSVASNITVINDNQIAAVTSAHGAGVVDVIVSNGSTNTTASAAYTYVALTPVINANGVSPNSGPTAGGTLITISGSGLTGTIAVTVGGAAATGVNVINDSQVQATTSAHAAGLVDVVISNGNTNTTAANAYTYVASMPVIDLNGISPSSGSTLGNTTITLTGSGFIGTTTVTIGGNPATSFSVLDDTHISATTPAHAAGTVNVTVTTAGGTSLPQTFTYVAPTPVINPNGVNPSSGSTAGGTVITISGFGLTGTTAVSVGGAAATNVVVVNDGQVQATTSSHVAGLVDVVVFNGSTNTTAAQAYTYIAPQPVINVNGINPSSGPTAGGTSITLSGSGFIGATAVTIGGSSATSFTVVNDTQINAVTPAHAAATVGVTVTTAGGVSASQTFTYLAPPALSNLTPTSGSTAGGTSITINGSGLTGTTAVSVGGAAASSVTVVNDTQITALTPAHTAGLVSVVITNPRGNATLANSYTYVQPSLSNCSAPLIAVAGAQLITCNSSSFLSVGVLSTPLVASGTNSVGTNCATYNQPVLATVSLLGVVAIPTVGVGGLFSPGLIGCSIRLCGNASCNAPGDTNTAPVSLGL